MRSNLCPCLQQRQRRVMDIWQPEKEVSVFLSFVGLRVHRQRTQDALSADEPRKQAQYPHWTWLASLTAAAPTDCRTQTAYLRIAPDPTPPAGPWPLLAEPTDLRRGPPSLRAQQPAECLRCLGWQQVQTGMKRREWNQDVAVFTPSSWLPDTAMTVGDVRGENSPEESVSHMTRADGARCDSGGGIMRAPCSIYRWLPHSQQAKRGFLQWVSVGSQEADRQCWGKKPNRVNYKQKRINKCNCSKHDIKIIFTLQGGLLISG